MFIELIFNTSPNVFRVFLFVALKWYSQQDGFHNNMAVSCEDKSHIALSISIKDSIVWHKAEMKMSVLTKSEGGMAYLHCLENQYSKSWLFSELAHCPLNEAVSVTNQAIYTASYKLYTTCL